MGRGLAAFEWGGARQVLPGGRRCRVELEDWMAIDALGRISAGARINGTGRAGAGHGTAFNVPEERDSAAPSIGTAAEVALGSMLALQETGVEAVGDREARRHGQAILAELAALQRDLLSGGPTPDQLRRLADLATTVPDATDPRLRGLLAAVVLRARVELARRGLD
jgi:hypothetical protein